jgi:predicted Zn-dependent protease
MPVSPHTSTNIVQTTFRPLSSTDTCYAHLGKTPDGVKRFLGRTTVRHDRGVTPEGEARFEHAAALRERGELDEARTILLELRAEFPDDVHVAVQTAWVHDSLGLEEDAVEHYEVAIAGDLDDDELRGALLGLGSTYRALGRDDDSARTFRTATERFPDDLALRVFQALTNYNLGHSRDAVADLVRVLVQSTSDPSILRYRRSLAAYAEDLDRSWLGVSPGP